MKKIVLLLSLLGANFYAKSQQYEYVHFPDSGVIWSEVYQSPLNFSTGNSYSEFRRFAMNGEDTLMGDYNYNKLFIFSDSVFVAQRAECIGGIREDSNKKVYYRGKNVYNGDYHYPINPVTNEVLLYNFSVGIGDTIENFHGWFEGEKCTVENVDTLLIDGSLRRILYFKYWWVSWIEGIGNASGLLFCSSDLPTNGIFNWLVCFEQNGERLYMHEDFNDCFPETDKKYQNLRKDKVAGINFSVLNPSTDNFCIQFSNYVSGTLSVVGIDGKKLLIKSFDTKNELHISLSSYKGVALFQLLTAKGENATQKIFIP